MMIPYNVFHFNMNLFQNKNSEFNHRQNADPADNADKPEMRISAKLARGDGGPVVNLDSELAAMLRRRNSD
jgi:hypothetical protein